VSKAFFELWLVTSHKLKRDAAEISSHRVFTPFTRPRTDSNVSFFSSLKMMIDLNLGTMMMNISMANLCGMTQNLYHHQVGNSILEGS